MNNRSGELISAGCAKGRGGTWNCATKLSGLNTEHLLELSGLYQVPMHSREAAMKDWPLRQAPCLPQHFFAIRDPPRRQPTHWASRVRARPALSARRQRSSTLSSTLSTAVVDCATSICQRRRAGYGRCSTEFESK